MNALERFHCVMNFERPDRLPFYEWMGYWPETLDRWYEEGLPRDVDLNTYFGYDRHEFLPINFNFIPAFERTILDEDELTRTVRDEAGCVKREFKYGSAMPHFIEFPIKTRRDFLEIKERLDAENPDRYPANWSDLVESYRTRDYPVGLLCRGLLAFGRDFMQFTDLMVAFMDEPEWMNEMMDFHTEFMLKLWERALAEVKVDFVLFGEDMAYKTGPMISPRTVREMMIPRYRRMSQFFRDHGVKHFIVDSDGDVRSLIPEFLAGGVTGILPLENNAGCNPVAIRDAYPRLQMIGGIDKQIIALGGDAMEQEVRTKAGELARKGGYIASFDHSVHPAVSLDTYKRYLELVWELANSAY
jgi:uroporphyrinogen decarboxylase